ncbi:MAG TPA: type VI secretion system baseplate subunit TssG [Steroidobacteraceae bacterium]
MADASRQSADAVRLLQDLETRFASYEFFAAMRRVECALPDLPRLGRAARSADEAVRLGQVPTLTFAPTMFVEAQRRADGKLWLGGVFFGLFGPNGPLPLHLSEYAHDRRHNFRDSTLASFADVFHHRLMCLFYRGWADAQPTVQSDRPDSDRFRAYVGALIGIGQETLRNRDAMPDAARLFHAGRLSGEVKNPEGLEVVLEDFFEERVRVREFQCEWMALTEEDRLYLGRTRTSSTLGLNATLGRSVWGAQSRFRIVAGPMALRAFERFLPGSVALKQLAAIVRSYVGFELHWDLQLILKRSEVPGAQLGTGTRLGWTSWLASSSRAHDADDVVLMNTALN